MRSTLRTKVTQAGFTLVEVMIIAPILILTIGGFVYTLSTIVADTLAIRDTNTMVYDTQGALDRIEQDARLSVQFLATSGPLPSPQGSDGNFTGTAAFTSSSSFNGGSNALIMSTLSTNLNPLDPNRQAVYFSNQPNPCDVTQVYNAKLLTTVIYYINNGSLYRRTYVPTWTTTAGANQVCTAPWQQDSCSPGYTNTTACQTSDAKIMDNVTSLSTAYYSTPGGTTDLGASSATTASTINVTIASSKTTAGQQVSNTASVRATKLNSSGVSTNSLAFTTQPSDTSVVVGDTNITIASLATNSPSYAWQRSTDGGNTWSNISGATNATLTLPSVDMSWDQNKLRVIATDQFGTSTTSTTATLTVNIWGSVAYQNGWKDYTSGTYPGAQYTKTSAGLVALRGLVAGGTATFDTTITTLPAEYRPTYRLTFYVGSYDSGNSGFGRVDVLPTGEVRFMSGTNTWVALDSIRFISSTATCTATANSTLVNGWQNYGSPYPPLSFCKDSSGRIEAMGLVRNGTTTFGTAMGSVPAGFQALQTLIVPAVDYTASFAAINIDSSNIVVRGQYNSYLSNNNIYIANNGAVTWNTPTILNGMTNYGSPFSTIQYGKTSDGMVSVKGLMQGGTVANGTVVFTLPSGFRPSMRVLLPSAANGHHARIDVDPNGNVILQAGGDTVWTSFDSVNFLADGS